MKYGFQIALGFLLTLVPQPALSQDTRQCIYQNARGMFVVAKSFSAIPAEFRNKARCRKAAPKTNPKQLDMTAQEFIRKAAAAGQVAKRPDEINIDGNKRRTTILSDLGEVRVQWPRSVEKLLGENIETITKEAWKAGTRAVSQNGFPYDMRKGSYDWNVIIMDEVPTSVDVNMGFGNCHPGWMRPPADIYMAAGRIAKGCSGNDRKSKDEIIESFMGTLVHELGHAIEFQLLQRAFTRRKRWHSEGFAVWFETLAGKNLPSRYRGNGRAEQRRRAKEVYSPNWTPAHFRGSWQDYTRAYMLLATISEKYSPRRLVQVYERFRKDQLPSLEAAVQKELNWSPQRWQNEVAKEFDLKK